MSYYSRFVKLLAIIFSGRLGERKDAERAETIKAMSAKLSADQIANMLTMPLGNVEEILSKN